MAATHGALRTELERLLEQDRGRLGDVFRLSSRGLDAPAIATELGVPTSNFVVNQRTIIRAILDGVLPSGPAIERQVASAVRTRLRRADLSSDARAHLSGVLAELEARSAEAIPAKSGDAPPQSAPAITGRGSLRAQVDAELRARADALIDVILQQTATEVDEYQRIISGDFALDELRDLVVRRDTCRSTSALISADRPDLTIEQAVLDWAGDVPLDAELIKTARGRLDYWRRR